MMPVEALDFVGHHGIVLASGVRCRIWPTRSPASRFAAAGDEIWAARDGKLMLVRRAGDRGMAHSLIVELSPSEAGDHYSVTTAGVQRPNYPEKGGRTLLWRRGALLPRHRAPAARIPPQAAPPEINLPAPQTLALEAKAATRISGALVAMSTANPSSTAACGRH